MVMGSRYPLAILILWCILVMQMPEGAGPRVESDKYPPLSPQKLPLNPGGGFGLTTGAAVKNVQAFHALIYNNIHINKAIPKPDRDTLRIIQYNVNSFVDLSGFKDNLERIRREIETLSPAAIIFLKVPREGLPLRSRFDLNLRKAGFKHTHFYANARSTVGILIASRAELEDKQGRKASASGTFISASIRVKTLRLYLIGAFLPSRSDVRPETIKEVSSFINSSMEANLVHSHFLLATNVNFRTLSGELGERKIPTASWQAQDIFITLGWPTPTFTSYRCDVRDQLLVSTLAKPYLNGAYLYLTPSSTHFPLVADFFVRGAADDLIEIRFTKAAVWFIIGSLLLILAVSGVGIYFWIRSKIYDY